MRPSDVARCCFVVFAALLVQHALLDLLRIGGAHPDLMILLPAGGGLVAGPERGAAFGFLSGLAADLLLPTTFGLSALVGCALGYGAGLIAGSASRSGWWITPLLGAAAAATGATAFALLAAVLGDGAAVTVHLLPALVVVVPAAAVLGPLAFRAVAWGLPSPVPSAGLPQSGLLR